MKKGVTVIILMILSFSWITAQNPNLERLNTYKIAFFTKRLNLTPQEAEKFWPVYNELQDRKAQIQQERMRIHRDVNQTWNTMSDKELSDLGDKIISLDVKESTLTQEYHLKFKAILPPLKVLRLYQAENQYKLQLLNELQNRKQGRNGPLPR